MIRPRSSWMVLPLRPASSDRPARSLISISEPSAIRTMAVEPLAVRISSPSSIVLAGGDGLAGVAGHAVEGAVDRLDAGHLRAAGHHLLDQRHDAEAEGQGEDGGEAIHTRRSMGRDAARDAGGRGLAPLAGLAEGAAAGDAAPGVVLDEQGARRGELAPHVGGNQGLEVVAAVEAAGDGSGAARRRRSGRSGHSRWRPGPLPATAGPRRGRRRPRPRADRSDRWRPGRRRRPAGRHSWKTGS